MNKTTRDFGSVAVGDRLPPLRIDVTAGLIVGGAIASRDFTPVHHDKAAAQATGLPDIFMNIITSNGLMSRYVTDWTGPEATLRSIELKLGAPNLPGMVMTITGEVTAKDEATGTLVVSVSGDNNVWGTHMAGKVCVALPREA
jgi:acyl dehydratase